MDHVFISYVHEDSEEVRSLCDELAEHEISTWLDRDEIVPGTRWKQAIRRAISEGSFFIACFSKEYSKRIKTYMNEELILAIEELRKRPRDRTWFIPIKLNECDIPDWGIGAGETLQDIQWVELYKDWVGGIQQILRSIGMTRLTPEEIEKGMERFKAWCMGHPAPDYNLALSGDASNGWSAKEVLEILEKRQKAGTLGKSDDLPEYILRVVARNPRKMRS